MRIEIKNLDKQIKNNMILSDINLELFGGHIYGLRGKNGCGKTMLMRCIAGLIKPSKGYIKIEEGKIKPTSETEKHLIKSRLKGWNCAEKSLKEKNKIPLVQTNYIPRDFSKSFSGYKK